MERAAYLAAIDADAGALIAAARQGLEAPVPSCPGWTVGHVVAHVGRAYRWIGEIVATQAQAPLLPTPNKHSYDRADPRLLAWFDESVQGFRAAVGAASDDERVWTWSADHSVGFWLRLMAHETAIHRYDAQLAHACTVPIAPELARSAVDFTLEFFVPLWRRLSLLPSHDETYHLQRTDGAGDWLLRFSAEDESVQAFRAGVVVSREQASAAVVLRGTASDLLLFLWRRGSSASLAVVGDAALVDRLFELAPPS